MKEEFKNLYQKFINHYGQDAQIMIIIEEMSELTKELCKYLRYKNTHKEKLDEIINNIHEETADVLNCVEQLELMFDSAEIEKFRQLKINRTLSRLNSNE